MCKTVSSLEEYIKECSTSGEPMLFRGQTCNEPPLANIYRTGTQKKPYTPSDQNDVSYDSNRDVAREREVLKLFQKQALPYLAFTPRNDYEWLAVAQHHGLKTRLLDWTTSPLVALFHAVEQMGAGPPERQAVVYCIKEPAHVDEAGDPFLVEAPQHYRPPHIAPRIAAQNSVFTIQDHNTTHFTNAHVIKIDRPAERHLKFELNKLGINRHALYVDIDNVAQSLNWQFKWGQHPLTRL